MSRKVFYVSITRVESFEVPADDEEDAKDKTLLRTRAQHRRWFSDEETVDVTAEEMA